MGLLVAGRGHEDSMMKLAEMAEKLERGAMIRAQGPFKDVAVPCCWVGGIWLNILLVAKRTKHRQYQSIAWIEQYNWTEWLPKV